MVGPNLMISADDQDEIGETRSRIGSQDRFNQLMWVYISTPMALKLDRFDFCNL